MDDGYKSVSCNDTDNSISMNINRKHAADSRLECIVLLEDKAFSENNLRVRPLRTRIETAKR
jgi:hypothetical protein